MMVQLRQTFSTHFTQIWQPWITNGTTVCMYTYILLVPFIRVLALYRKTCRVFNYVLFDKIIISHKVTWSTFTATHVCMCTLYIYLTTDLLLPYSYTNTTPFLRVSL